MKNLLIIFFVVIFGFCAKAQMTKENVEGTVSFVSSQNVYVKFKSTNGIIVGDTLYTTNNNSLVPAMIVKNLSTTSIVCGPIISIKFNVNDNITAKRRIESKKPEKIKPIIKDSLNEAIDSTKKSKLKEKLNQQKIFGRVAVSSISNFSKTESHDSYIYNYSLSFNINNIANSKFSVESNILFRQEKGKSSEVQANIFNGLKIYNLALKYDIGKYSYISLGRRINPVISNIGAIDGLQIEKSLGAFSVGGFVGSRPHYLDYSFNFNLMQYGAYLGHNFQTPKRNMQNSLAFVEQTNNSKTDRRFLYFQHSSSLLKNVNIYYSLELDLYKVLVNEQKQNTLSLTNTYFSLRYRPFKRLTLSGTYDSRKNIIYYETDKSYIAALLETESRQGYGLQLNYNIAKNLYFGAKVGYKFQKKDLRPTKNGYAFISHNNLFKSKVSSTLTATILETTYLNGNIYNLRFSRSLISDRINFSIGYSYANYQIQKAEKQLIQHIAELNISAEIIKKLSLSLSFETNYEKPIQFNRLYLLIRKRF
jgi:hypothetical protein